MSDVRNDMIDGQSAFEDELECIAAAVRTRRKSKGWTQGKLAAEASVDEATLRVLEGAKMLPLPPTIERIARALQVNLNRKRDGSG